MVNTLLQEVKPLTFIKEKPLNRLETLRILKPFLDMVLSIKHAFTDSIPLLYDFAILLPVADQADWTASLLKRRIDRRYSRLCRIVNEINGLDFKKALPGVSAEDFIFSRIDFSRYREIEEEDFKKIFPEGLTDFDETFFKKNFGLGKCEIQSLIESSYKRTERFYRLQRETPLILSVMRSLDISLEDLPLFTFSEMENELEMLPGFLEKNAVLPCGEILSSAMLYSLLVFSLDEVIVTHEDGMTTKLFVSAEGDLSGTFRPGDKPWTRVLIPANSNLPLSLLDKIPE